MIKEAEKNEDGDDEVMPIVKGKVVGYDL